MPTLHINGWTPSARAIAITLGEKGIDYELVEHDWQDTPAAFAPFAGNREIANSLEGEFPILVDGGQTFSDSYFILEYIDERDPAAPLLPDDAYGQWRWQAFARFLGERALPAVSSLGVARRFGLLESDSSVAVADLPTVERRIAWLNALSNPLDGKVIGESHRKLRLLLERLDTMLGESTGSWLLGSRYTLADIAAYVLVDPLLCGALGNVDVGATDTLRDWHERVGRRSAVQQAMGGWEMEFLPGPEHARWG